MILGTARNREQVQLLFFPLGLKSLLRALGFSALLATVCLPLMDEASAGMFGLFKRYDVHLSPEVRGRVFKDGEPVSDLRISRSLTYESELIDRTHTDAEGRFRFSEKWIRSGIPGRALDETRNRQIVYATVEDQHFLLWHYTTDSIEPEQTVTEKLRTLNCDLSSPEKLQHFYWVEHSDFTHDVISICRWD